MRPCRMFQHYNFFRKGKKIELTIEAIWKIPLESGNRSLPQLSPQRRLMEIVKSHAGTDPSQLSKQRCSEVFTLPGYEEVLLSA